MIHSIFICCLFILILSYLYYHYNINKLILLDQNFYNINDIDPKLNNIYINLGSIHNEIKKISNWTQWPEKYLYNEKIGKWNIYPFFAFDTWVNENCNKCPYIYHFIKSIPNIKLATLSKMDPFVTLTPHKGWGNYSNNVIRCHFGLRIPENKCYISVTSDNSHEEIKYLENNKWTIFDDSKLHYSSNQSNEIRIVLIIDIHRPSHIKKGTSDVKDSSELMNIIQYFKKKNV
jgi:ornithine lipid ester-linked acyl 2-hydroxylase